VGVGRGQVNEVLLYRHNKTFILTYCVTDLEVCKNKMYMNAQVNRN